ncbi:hypothetical protein [Streptosporangium sp. NPDC002607]
MLPRKSGRTPGPISGRRVGVLAIAAVSGILMTSNQAPANAAIGQVQALGSISQLNADSTLDGRLSPNPNPNPSRRQYREERPSDRWRGRPNRHQDRPYDRYRGRRGNDFNENEGPGRERLTRSERMMRELQNDPSFPEIIIREK